ncbi:hypothetical protein FGRMN_2838 [Fusarium graminum]|nr:hypothetical protein FGRMN_2838 [Fusarium graminum]
MADVEVETPASFVCTVLSEFPIKKPNHSYHYLAANDNPEKLATDIRKAYKEHVGRFNRVFHRSILLKKPVVSIAKLSKVTTLQNTDQKQVFVQSKVYDSTLTSALQDPAILRNVDIETFLHEYKDVLGEIDGTTPQAAILIHLVNDPTASKIIGIAGSAVSVTLGLVGAFML